jgi:hypothetical protein
MLPNQPLKTSAALILALGSISAPAAAARVLPPDPPCSSCGYSELGQRASGSTVNPPPAIVRVESRSGFDWGDAGIGAAGGIAISIASLGGALAVSQRRARRPGNPPALIG